MMKEKTLTNTNVAEAKAATPDLQVFGNGDMWKLLCKASSESEGWMKSTKAMEVPGGCIVQVTTHKRGHDGSFAVAEALVPVSHVCIQDEEDGNGRFLAPMQPALHGDVYSYAPALYTPSYEDCERVAKDPEHYARMLGRKRFEELYPGIRLPPVAQDDNDQG